MQLSTELASHLNWYTFSFEIQSVKNCWIFQSTLINIKWTLTKKARFARTNPRALSWARPQRFNISQLVKWSLLSLSYMRQEIAVRSCRHWFLCVLRNLNLLCGHFLMAICFRNWNRTDHDMWVILTTSWSLESGHDLEMSIIPYRTEMYFIPFKMWQICN